MTIQEAIKSGKPFRRPEFLLRFAIKNPTDSQYLLPCDIRSWSIYDEERGQLIENQYKIYSRDNNEITMKDILATDWEIKQ